MGFFGLSTKAEVRQIANQAVVTTANNLAKAGLYNEKMFGWLFNNQPVFWGDNPLEYIKNGYQGNGDVYSAIDLILTKLSYCPLLLYSVKEDKIQKAYQYKTLASHDVARAKLLNVQTKALTETHVQAISDLINKPNPYQTTSEWLKQLAGFYLLNGNSYNYYVGPNPANKKWTEMYVLPASMINIVSGGDFNPVKGYNVMFSRNYNDNLPDFPAAQVSHFKTFNPEFTTFGSQLYGQSPLRAYIMTLVANKDARIEKIKQIKNGGAMGILSPDMANGAPAISDPMVKADLKKQISSAKSSSELVDRIFVSGAPAKWTQFGLSTTDLQLLEGIKLDTVDICKAFHINPNLLANQDASTDNNMEHAERQFIYNCIMTLGNTLTDKLTRDICKPYEKNGERLMLMFDYSVLPELSDDMAKVATALKSMDWLTYNEKREFQGWGKSTEPNADKLMVSKNSTLLEDIELNDTAFTNASPTN